MTENLQAMADLEEEFANKYKAKPLDKYLKKDLLRVIEVMNDVLDETATNLYIAERRLEEAGV